MAELQIMQRTIFYFMIIVASIVDIESQTAPDEAPAELNTGLVSSTYYKNILYFFTKIPFTILFNVFSKVNATTYILQIIVCFCITGFQKLDDITNCAPI